MVNLKFKQLENLPQDSIAGTLYFLSNGELYLGKSDSTFLQIGQVDNSLITTLTNSLNTHELSLINSEDGLHGIRIWDGKFEQFNSESFTWDEIRLNNNITAEDIGTYTKEQIDNAILNSSVKGDNGLSAYEVAIDNGFVGTEIDWMNSLKGENGANWYTLNGDLNSPLGNIGDYGINIDGRIFVKEAIGWTYSGTDLKGQQGEKGESGDSFSIVKTYATIAEMNSDFTNAELPVGSFVIISSDEPDTDPDNGKVYIKSDTEFRFHSILRGLRGETGKDGKNGERGRGVTVKGQVVGESDLPITAEVGDAYWTDDGRLYIWSDNPLEVAEPTFVRSPSLIGKEGQRGLQGEKGDTPTLNDATTTSKGVVQVGGGLTVNNGIVSTVNKGYLCAQRSDSNQSLTAVNQKLVFNSKLSGIGIPYNTTTGEFTLTGGKTYRVTCSGSFSFGGANQWVSIALMYASGNRSSSVAIWYSVTGTASHEASAGNFDLIFTPEKSGNCSMVVNSISTNTTAMLRYQYCRLIVQEV